MQMDDMRGMEVNGKMKMDHSNVKNDKMANEMKMDSTMTHMDHSKMENSDMKMDNKESNTMEGMDPPAGRAGMFSEYNYDYLKSPEKTTYAKGTPVNEILLNLTGNMNRYIWSMNGVP